MASLPRSRKQLQQIRNLGKRKRDERSEKQLEAVRKNAFIVSQRPRNQNQIEAARKTAKSGVMNTEVQRKKASELRKRLNKLQRRENHPLWLGDSIVREYDNFTEELKEQIRLRDNRRCRVCGIYEINNGKRLEVHHIDYNKKNSAINNLISLCVRCHTKTNYKRSYWCSYFQRIL